MNDRKARTRTLIQLGGLIEKIGLLEMLNLTPGDDLQRDPDCFEHAAILMGALGEIREILCGNEDEVVAQKILWSERGKEMLGENK